MSRFAAVKFVKSHYTLGRKQSKFELNFTLTHPNLRLKADKFGV
ncbi:hypothetical protein CAMRE0001_0865 [Campylobacter rectus RM3267]|uniref:Uncharacterized protein n=1 Tax=Campylobacter rectus RM3267 TaxID=553218 RepID=B9D1Z1_CAMRE|nr:hypothetical protein CAMRE0001_0865 [Campylobacter rectus RM3267]